MKDRHRKQWERLGASDPYWAVLSHSAKKGGKWDKEEFFQTGVDEIDAVLTHLSDLGITIRYGLALDFGCGVGRLSRALSRHFTRVVGVDISESMLEEAHAANSEYRNIEFIHNTDEDLRKFPTGSVDFIYSNIVLQHMPPEQQCLFLRELCRVLRSDAVLVFQTPSRSNLRTLWGWVYTLLGNRILNIGRRMIYGSSGVMEIHALRKDQVLRILPLEGMTIVDMERYDSAGKAFISYRYYAVKS